MTVRRRGRLGNFSTAALALLALGGVAVQPSLAQNRTLATLGDVPTLMPAPFHPHAATAVYSAMLYDGSPYYGVLRYWH
jgi:hypothetical protein